MNFLRALDAGEPIVIYGDGSASRDFVHVDDIAGAIEAALVADVPSGTVVHLASGRETTLKELADICRAATGAPGHPVELRPRRAGEVERNFASYGLAAASPVLRVRRARGRCRLDLAVDEANVNGPDGTVSPGPTMERPPIRGRCSRNRRP